MTTLQRSLIAIVVLVSLAIPLVLRQQSAARQRAANETLRQQAAQLAEQQTKNDRLAALAVRPDGAEAPASAEAPATAAVRLGVQTETVRSQSNALPERQAESRALPAVADGPVVPPSESEKQQMEARMADNKMWLIALFMYPRKNNGHLPQTLNDAASVLQGQNEATANSADQFEIIYQGSFSALANPQNAIVLKQKEAVRYGNRWARAYGYGDGHVEVHVQAKADFSDWENQHLPSPAANRP